MQPPNAIYGSYYPCMVRLPEADGWGEPIKDCKVYATDTGLAVFLTPGEPLFSSPGVPSVPFARPEGYSLTNGHVFVTEAGKVLVQTAGAQRCCGDAMRHWNPPGWQLYMAPWPGEVS